MNQLQEREDFTKKMLQTLVKEQREMSEKLEYLENKSRQIYVVKRGLEGNDLIGFTMESDGSLSLKISQVSSKKNEASTLS